MTKSKNLNDKETNIIYNIIDSICNKYTDQPNTLIVRTSLYNELISNFPLSLKSYQIKLDDEDSIYSFYNYIASNLINVLLEHRNKIIEKII